MIITDKNLPSYQKNQRKGLQIRAGKTSTVACWYEDLCRELLQFNLDVIYLLFPIIQSHRERIVTSSRMTMAFRKFLCFCFSFRKVSRLVSLGFCRWKEVSSSPPPVSFPENGNRFGKLLSKAGENSRGSTKIDNTDGRHFISYVIYGDYCRSLLVCFCS